MKNLNSNTSFDVEKVRKDFPILSRTINASPSITFPLSDYRLCDNDGDGSGLQP
jgi:selenocysteine lyase/cysteine desulfurase